MSSGVLAFFNNKDGVGKTSLVYHLSWMLADMGMRVLACDLDPQADLTAAFLDEEQLAELWIEPRTDAATIYRCIRPGNGVGEPREPQLQRITSDLALIPGDLALSGLEDQLSEEWAQSLGSLDPYRPLRVLAAFWQVVQLGRNPIPLRW
jgi:chromosome partitioning protein